jgi:hypothetical protein
METFGFMVIWGLVALLVIAINTILHGGRGGGVI